MWMIKKGKEKMMVMKVKEKKMKMVVRGKKERKVKEKVTNGTLMDSNLHF